MDSLISVIVPVYNVENYLDRCVDSIVNQTYKNLEIILVDDGSTDSSGRKCDEWKKKDNRILVVHKKNGGLSDARNAGLEVANGTYIGFVDSDDFISLDMYRILLKTMIETNSDIVECNRRSFTDSDIIHEANTDSFSVEVFGSEKALLELILERKLKQTAWNKLYQRQIITTLFEVGKINEDEYWTYQIFGKANTIAAVNAELYYYYQRESSIMHEKYSIKRLDGVIARKERLVYIENNYPNLFNQACVSYLWACFYHYQVICRNKQVDNDSYYRKTLHSEYRKNYTSEAVKLQPQKQRNWLKFFWLFPNITCMIRNCLKIGL